MKASRHTTDDEDLYKLRATQVLGLFKKKASHPLIWLKHL